MKRRDLERHLRSVGCFLHHHGGKHDVWVNAATAARTSVPRHTALKRGTVKAICRALGVPLPPGM